MVRLILEGLGVVLLLIITVVDIIIPLFTKRQFFWFIRSFFKEKVRTSFEQQLDDARKAYNDASKKWDEVKDSATKEADEAKEKLAKAEEAYADALRKKKGFNN